MFVDDDEFGYIVFLTDQFAHTYVDKYTVYLPSDDLFGVILSY